MSSTGNGNGKLTYWIMGSLLGIVMLFGSVGLAANRSDILELRQKAEIRTEAIYELRAEITALRVELEAAKREAGASICRLESKVDDVRERQGQRVFRTPCP